MVVLGLAVSGAGAALAGGVTSRTAFGTTYGSTSTGFAILEVLVGLVLAAAAALLLLERATAVLGTTAVLVGAVWFAPVFVGWDGGPELVRSLGQVAAPVLPALALAVAVFVPPPPRGVPRVALGVIVSAGVTATVAAAVWLELVRNPIRDLHCWSNCSANSFLVDDDIGLVHHLTPVVLVLGVATGALAFLVAGVRFARAGGVARRSAGPALLFGSLSGAALAAYAAALQLAPREAPDRPLYAWLFGARCAALLGLGVALAWLAIRPRLVRGLVTRLAVELERTSDTGGLSRVLATALGDPGLRLAYPIGPSDRIVDSEGRPLAFEPARRATAIVGGDDLIALVDSRASGPHAIELALGPAAHLALGNERLRAEALARLADVSESRARIVETADNARRRMERDLHDGAQQRILALTYDLRVALDIAESGGHTAEATALREALEGTIVASEELRDLAHGIFPAELGASGLAAALESLADLRPLRLAVDLPPGRRYPEDIETAAYAAVAESLDAAPAGVTATVREQDGSLCLAVDGVADWGSHLVRIEDRIGAVGGAVTVHRGRLELALPAGS